MIILHQEYLGATVSFFRAPGHGTLTAYMYIDYRETIPTAQIILHVGNFAIFLLIPGSLLSI